MSPGMMTSRNHGGFGFQHGARSRFSPVPAPRTRAAARPRFAVAPNDAGGSSITLDENEAVSVGTDADGNLTIAINPKPENGNGLGQRGARRGLSGCGVDKMAVSANSDGSITIRPEGDGTLELVGDPLSGAVTIVELQPERLNTTPSGQ